MKTAVTILEVPVLVAQRLCEQMVFQRRELTAVAHEILPEVVRRVINAEIHGSPLPRNKRPFHERRKREYRVVTAHANSDLIANPRVNVAILALAAGPGVSG